ncbi:hypothetical protein BOTBODRAFT_99933 [Botryobasidium botryosum FD-172 SS1]|uniref:Amidohydrolase-related domain-containing protein n=1 Tax=Botryobasidium botryosum (strain FD-172 SS1) TaxID=930990 RepID=A0A067N055_BOTB1|nr:hypothetical protein BOTBODRAFT_99933 [Botryobasidium botryosum FD-172 SS1]
MSDKYGPLPVAASGRARSPPAQRLAMPLLITSISLISFLVYFSTLPSVPIRRPSIPIFGKQVIAQCRALRDTPAPPESFFARTQSDRFVSGTKPIWIRNATIWTGGDNGLETLEGDILIDGGIIKAVGGVPRALLRHYRDVVEINAAKAWVTPGIVDIHSHIGVDSIPQLDGASDYYSVHGIAQPWMRSIDGLNTHDASYKLSIAGGVTTSLILPGSAAAIASTGGQAFAIKLRDTPEGSPTSKVIEPPHTLNGTRVDPSLPLRWRHMKHACGENPSGAFKGTRFDTAWSFRHAYNEARKVKEQQDAYCEKALAGQWKGLEPSIPENLQWEALVDVLRGRVKINVHCYESVDFDAMVRLSNEFQFPISAFHHAHEAYLVPDLIKKTYGGTPAIALFAANARYKREAYRASEFAPKILAEHGLRVVMKSDHPIQNSRYLVYEAAQAHYYGLPHNLALSSVITTPAEVAGFGHRLGYVRKGYDADLVIWDSHPLTLGATPVQVWIDGIAQITSPFVSRKPKTFQVLPDTPDFSKEAGDAVRHEGLPPLEPKKVKGVVFTNVRTIWSDEDSEIKSVTASGTPSTVVVKNGAIKCIVTDSEPCLAELSNNGGYPMDTVDLQGGSLAPGLVSFGAGLGLVEILQEPSTNDGSVYDPVRGSVPSIVGGDNSVIRAHDGLQFGGRDTLLAYRAGVTTAITPPSSSGVIAGLSTAFYTGAEHKLEEGAVLKKIAALHVAIKHFAEQPSISSQIATLRTLLLSNETSGENWFREVAQGKIPLVVDVHKADHMASLLLLKEEVEERSGKTLRMAFARATESHLLAKEIGAAGVGVILSPARPFPLEFDQRRIVPGPPLTEETTVAILLKHNVTVALGILEEWEARNTRFDIGWAALEASGRVDKQQALALASTNLEKIFDIKAHGPRELVAYQGGDILDMQSKVVAVISARRAQVALL